MTAKISVVMASFNGIKFIGEQLDSIRSQTLQPDEVIIRDDKSTDGTFEFCREYISRNNLTGWHVSQNDSNLGVCKNFRLALSMCTGDYIFTCDQDDIWMNEKIQCMISVMDSRPEIKLLASNYIPVVNGERINAKVKNIKRDDGSVIPFRLSDTWLDNMRPGCTYCFRRELLDKFNVMDIENQIHDSMLWKYAITSDSLYLLNRLLILYRRHGDNATNQFHRIPPNITQRIADIDDESKMYRRFIDASDGLDIPESNQKLMKAKINFLTRRKIIIAKRNAIRTALFVLMNFKYYPTYRNALSDIYASIFLRT